MSAVGLILLLGLLTLATRALGLAATTYMPDRAWLRGWLDQLPGAVFVALITPMVLQAGWAGMIATAPVFFVMRATGQFTLAIVVGVLVFAGVDFLIGR